MFIHMRFLIDPSSLSSIGDIVLTTPVYQVYLQAGTGCQDSLPRQKEFRSIIESNPYVDKVHYWQDDIADTIKELTAENFDTIIDLHHNLSTLKIKSALPAKSFSFRKLNVEKWLMTKFQMEPASGYSYYRQRYLDTVLPFGVKNDGEGLDYFIPEKTMWCPVIFPDILTVIMCAW